MGGIQVLGANKIDAGQNIAASMMNNSSTVGNPTAEKSSLPAAPAPKWFPE
jgi:hypothetical protein